MTRAAHCKTVGNVKPIFRVIGPSFDMMSYNVTTDLATYLASVSVAFENGLSPFCILLGFSELLHFWRNAALPGWVIWPISDSSFFYHCLAHFFAVFWGHCLPFVPGFLSLLELAFIFAAWKLAAFQRKVGAALELGGDLLPHLRALFAFPVSRTIPRNLAFSFFSMRKARAISIVIFSAICP